MSTVKATNLQHASSSSVNAVTTSGGDLTNAAGVSFMGGSKNLLYNGAMQVAQRGTSATTISSSTYATADRWQQTMDSLGAWTQSVENDAPTGSGLRKSLKVLCTTADAAPAANDFLQIRQTLEGQDLQRIAKGTSSAQQLTLSFWVKSNVTGTYIVGLRDADNSRSVSASYTISASATWERKTMTFPADTTGAFDNDNAGSLAFNFWLAAGSTFTSGTLATTWGAEVSANVAVGQTNLAAATNNYWQVTGIQLEIGAVGTSFEFKSYGQELRECQRYYYLHISGADKYFANSMMWNATTMTAYFSFPVTMRSTPVLVASSGTNYYLNDRNGGNDTFNSLTIQNPSTTGTAIYNNTEISGTAGHAGILYTNNASASVAVSAEL